MSEREDLAAVIELHAQRDTWLGIADAILAAGYRKVDIVPQEFLDSLPDEAPGLLAAVKEVRERLAKEVDTTDPPQAAPRARIPWRSDPRIEEDKDGTLDEFVAHNAMVHFEAMSENSWWIGIDLPNGRSWHINCGAVNPAAKGYAHVQVSQ